MNIPPKHTLIFCIALIMISLAYPKELFSQNKINPEHYGSDSDSIPVFHYDIVRNRPDSVARLTFIIYPFEEALNDVSNNVIQAYCSYDLNKKVNLYCTASIAYNEDRGAGGPRPLVYIPYFNIETGSNIYFYRKSLTANSRMFFPTDPGNSLSAKFIRNHLIKIGIHGGVGFLNSTIASYNKELIGYNTSDPTQKKLDIKNSLPQYTYAATNAQTPYLSAGLVMENVKDLAINIEKLKRKEIMHKTSFYLDLLASPYSHYDDIVIPDYIEIPKGIYNVNQYSPKQLFGFRAGWSYYSLKKLGLAFGAEGGIMPNSGAFLNLKIGLAFSPKGNR